jgi:O-antigen/teichoic acid export membrane protein
VAPPLGDKRWSIRSWLLVLLRTRLRPLLGGSIRRDALWLLVSQAGALIATFIATPIELSRMGYEHYGLVVVLSAAVSYVGMFDIGASWGVMRFVPWHRARGSDLSVQRVVAAAFVISLGVGSVLGGLVVVLAPTLGSLLDASAPTRGEITNAVRITGVFVPVFLVSSMFSGLGRAVDMFALVGLVAAGQVIALNIVWVVVAGSSDDVVKVLIGQAVIGILAIAVTAACIKVFRGWALRPRAPDRQALRQITGFGAKTSSGQAGLGLLMTADKPVLASIMPVGIIPAYSIPYALAVRITLVSSSVSSAVFPPLVAALASEKLRLFASLRERTLTIVGVISGLLAVNCVFAGQPLLEWWLGPKLASSGWQALAVLGVGFGILACGSIGNVLLDAAGRPGAAATVMVCGGIGGLALAGALAALFDTATAPSVGTCAGLSFIGLVNLELARNLVVPLSRRRLILMVFGRWIPVIAVATILRLGCNLVGTAPLISVLVIGAGTSASALACLRSLSSAGGSVEESGNPGELSGREAGGAMASGAQ